MMTQIEMRNNFIIVRAYTGIHKSRELEMTRAR